MQSLGDLDKTNQNVKVSKLAMLMRNELDESKRADTDSGQGNGSSVTSLAMVTSVSSPHLNKPIIKVNDESIEDEEEESQEPGGIGNCWPLCCYNRK